MPANRWRLPPTRKGQETRERIVSSAAALMFRNGVEGTTLDEVTESAHVGKSQIYHYFDDKAALVAAVVEYQATQVLDAGGPQTMTLDSWAAWDAWREAVVTSYAASGCVGGCPIGSLSGELADRDEDSRVRLAAAFERWQRGFEHGLASMREAGALRADADVPTLATCVLASLEGGLLLSQVTKSEHALRTALDGAIALLRSWSPEEYSRP
ncbi:TetR/AcrR family transcriptional regulator [Humibacter albus]|uniref:TetR/AcrR family transcriptional regulator n=1 Tax=Humibacter albus TaxID=427754 RepID=UPI00047EC48A|nr:TetR/AcrR family transcriptional regulator [Humibacter albus]